MRSPGINRTIAFFQSRRFPWIRPRCVVFPLICIVRTEATRTLNPVSTARLISMRLACRSTSKETWL